MREQPNRHGEAPLAAILGAATTSLLDVGESLDGSRNDLLRDIRAEADRLDRMVRDLLAITRIDAGIDTTTPAGKGLFQMMGVFAEFERAMIRERYSTLREAGPVPPWWGSSIGALDLVLGWLRRKAAFRVTYCFDV